MAYVWNVKLTFLFTFHRHVEHWQWALFAQIDVISDIISQPFNVKLPLNIHAALKFETWNSVSNANPHIQNHTHIHQNPSHIHFASLRFRLLHSFFFCSFRLSFFHSFGSYYYFIQRGRVRALCSIQYQINPRCSKCLCTRAYLCKHTHVWTFEYFSYHFHTHNIQTGAIVIV